MYSEITVILQLILLTRVPGSAGSGGFWTVRCDEEQVCAVRESEVLLSCSYSHSDIQSVVWFRPKQRDKWRSEDVPEDLGLDADYTARVEHVQNTDSTSRLIIRDLRNTDSGEYRLMGVTLNGEIYISNTAVNLTITDIEVKRTHDEQTVNLTCYTSCKLKLNWSVWYRNGQRVGVTSYQNAEPLIVSRDKAGSYSCSVKDKRSIVYSPAVCVWGWNCFSVTYTDRRICVLEGSSVSIPCSYSYPSDHTLNKTHWFHDKSDVRKVERFAGRVEYAGGENRNCTLTLSDLRLRDSGDYRFTFITNEASEVFTGSPGVQLSVAGVNGTVNAVTVFRQTVVLSCQTACAPTDDFTYIWYKNRQIITDKLTKYNKLYLDLPSYSDTDQYACAVKGVKGDDGGAVGSWWANPAVWGAVGVMSALLLILLSSVFYKRRRKSGDEAATYALTSSTTINIYSTLTPESSSDTGVYTELQKRPAEEEYETLHIKHPAAYIKPVH